MIHPRADEASEAQARLVHSETVADATYCNTLSGHVKLLDYSTALFFVMAHAHRLTYFLFWAGQAYHHHFLQGHARPDIRVHKKPLLMVTMHSLWSSFTA